MRESLSQRVRTRLAAEMDRKHLSQTDVAKLLRWSQSRVSKLLHGHTQIGLEELDALCFAVGISLVESVRDHGLEFVAEMTPTELRLLERLREVEAKTRDAIMHLLDVKAPPAPRYALKPSSRVQNRNKAPR